MNEDCPFTEEQIEWLKNSLRISLDKIDGFGYSAVLQVDLILDCSVISTEKICL